MRVANTPAVITCSDVMAKEHPELVVAYMQRERYFWARIGYDRVLKTTEGTQSDPEDRGVISLWGKAPLPAKVWLGGPGEG